MSRRRFQSRNQILLFTASICSTAPHTSSIDSLECCFFSARDVTRKFSHFLFFTFLWGFIETKWREAEREEKLLRVSIGFIEWAVRGSLLCCISSCCVCGVAFIQFRLMLFSIIYECYDNVQFSHNTTPAERQLVACTYCTMCSVDGL